jgi:hypothetical protein
MPMTLSGRDVRRPISVIEIELVFVASTVAGLAIRSRSVERRVLKMLWSLANSLMRADS